MMNLMVGNARLLAEVCGLLLGLAGSAACAAVASEAAAPPAVADFFRAPRFSAPRLSPDGRHLAAVVNQTGGSLDLAVLDIEQPQNSRIVASLVEAEINNAYWVNNDRLVFDARGRISGEGRAVAQGLWAVDRDGSNLKQWISATPFASAANTPLHKRVMHWYWSLHSTLDDGSDDVIVQQLVVEKPGRVTGTILARLNTRSGERHPLTEGAPERVMHWLLDRNGQPVFATGYDDKDGYRIYRRQALGWQLWEQGDLHHGLKQIPLWFSADQRQLLLLRRAADGLQQLYRATSTEPDAASQALLRLDGHDLSPGLVIDRASERLLGVHYETEGPGTTWFEPLLRDAQREVDALLPDGVNRLDCRRCLDAPTLLVTSYSDRASPNFYLYNRESKQLQVLARSRPWIKPEQMGPRQVQRFVARDGLPIPVQLTHPPGPAQGPRPTILLVHGGPWARGNHWVWEPQAQLLATRGYLVVEPEFRGSTGYGFKHFKAGWKQWGLAMQDDLVDAVQWAVKQGLADPKRICIAGASYGGYAALMGLARDGELYRCAVDWVGVADLDLLYSIHWSDISEDYARYRMPVLLGDREADAKRLHDTSPLYLADRINKPLLMAYGGLDHRVSSKHGEDLRAALAKRRPEQAAELEWILYADEGHGWRKPVNIVDFWSRVERFLDRQVGGQAGQ